MRDVTVRAGKLGGGEGQVLAGQGGEDGPLEHADGEARLEVEGALLEVQRGGRIFAVRDAAEVAAAQGGRVGVVVVVRVVGGGGCVRVAGGVRGRGIGIHLGGYDRLMKLRAGCLKDGVYLQDGRG